MKRPCVYRLTGDLRKLLINNFLIVLLCLISFKSFSQDVIQFKDGERYTGYSIRVSGEQLLCKPTKDGISKGCFLKDVTYFTLNNKKVKYKVQQDGSLRKFVEGYEYVFNKPDSSVKRNKYKKALVLQDNSEVEYTARRNTKKYVRYVCKKGGEKKKVSCRNQI